jgi:cyanophycinase
VRTSFLASIATLLLLPIAASAGTPLAGRWDGVFHGGRGDQDVVLICRPGSNGALGGLVYFGGDLMGPIENGSLAGDSLRFNVMNFGFLAKRRGDQMALQMVIAHGKTHDMALHFTSADTSALAQSPAAAAAARARSGVDWKVVPDAVLASHRVAAGVPAGTAPALRPGSLLLVGGGPSQEDISGEFRRLAGGDKARIVVIPTASIDPGVDVAELTNADRWAQGLGVSRVTVLHTTSRAKADSEDFVRPLREATGVWLPGGEAGRIIVSYLGTRTEKELLALLARGGVIGGTSAGALVWGSESMIFRQPGDGSPFVMGDTAALLIDDPRAVGFGALRNVLISPHFAEFRMQGALEKTMTARPQLIGIGIDEATALEVHGDIGTVFGRGHVTVYDGRSHGDAHGSLVLPAGARYDLARKVTI